MTITINGTTGITTPEVTLDNSSADGGQVVLKSSGYSNWNWDNYSGNLRAYYGSTEAMRIDSSGNVGIGTSSPTGYGTPNLHINGTTPLIHLTTPTTGTTSGDGTQIAVSGLDFQITNIEAGNLVFGTSSAERMRIDSSGNLLVGATSPIDNSRLLVTQSGNATALAISGNSAGGSAHIRNVSAQANFTAMYMLTSTSTVAGGIYCSGSTTNYATSSDYRLKENIQPMQNALATVAQLNPVTYTWKADGSDGQGFIAHELQAVVPDCVTGEKDAMDEEGNPVYQGIDTSFLVATLTKAIQEQQEQIELMKQEIASLKGAA